MESRKFGAKDVTDASVEEVKNWVDDLEDLDEAFGKWADQTFQQGERRAAEIIFNSQVYTSSLRSAMSDESYLRSFLTPERRKEIQKQVFDWLKSQNVEIEEDDQDEE